MSKITGTGFHVRRFVAHKRGCTARRHALAGEWNTAWAIGCRNDDGDFAWRHPVTGKMMRHHYLVIRCNNPECPALIGVRVDEIDSRLERW